jgi:hypothetical protein
MYNYRCHAEFSGFNCIKPHRRLYVLMDKKTDKHAETKQSALSRNK